MNLLSSNPTSPIPNNPSATSQNDTKPAEPVNTNSRENNTKLAQMKLKPLSHLKVNMRKLSTPKSPQKLFQALKITKSQYKLALDLDGSGFTNDESLRVLCNNLARLGPLSTLSLSLTNYEWGNSTKLVKLFTALRHLSLLSTISLKFKECHRMNEREVFQSLFSGLRDLKSLSSLKLTFQGCLLSDDITGIIASQLHHLRFLSNFYLHFYGASGRNTRLCCPGLKDLTSLPSIGSIFTGYCQDRDRQNKQIESLARALRKHKNWLTSLHLNFGDWENVSDSGIQAFSSELGRLKRLKALNYDFSRYKGINNKGIESFFSALKRLSRLSSLQLDFQDCKYINSSTIKFVSDGLKSLSLLSNLSLDLSRCFCIGSKELESLFFALNNLRSLSTLRLMFEGFISIRDDQIEIIGVGLKEMNSLSTLTLSFKGCNNVTDKGVESFCTYLRQLNSLRYLNLNFQCLNFSDKALESVSKSLCCLENLSSLNLNFKGTPLVLKP